MKKNYTVSLDKEVVEVLQPYLEKKGMSFSGFLNQASVEYVEALKNLNLPDDVAKMPLGEFMGLFSRMMKGMRAEKPKVKNGI